MVRLTQFDDTWDVKTQYTNKYKFVLKKMSFVMLCEIMKK